MIGDRIETNISGGLDVPLPKMYPVKVSFDTTALDDIEDAVRTEFQRNDIGSSIKPGASIAVGCGSRGIANMALVAKTAVAEIKKRGAHPFIFPAMGSHGGATVEGQTAVLAGYGITAETMGCPIRATMETVQLSSLKDGTPVFIDQYASAADGIVLINRIKPHTTFRGVIESGIVKMMSIGMGKIKAATCYHQQGMDIFGELLPKVANVIMEERPFLFGIGLLENALDQTAIIEAIPPETLIERETKLQAISKQMIGKLFFEEIDVLIIDEMGKNISGAGFDPNITGRNHRDVGHWDGPAIKRIVVLDLTRETKGNATGLGVADVITMKLYRQIDIDSTYANVITSAYLDGAAIPIIMNTAMEAVQLAVKTSIRVKEGFCRIVRIKNTLELSEIMVSEPMIEEVESHPQMQVQGAARPLQIDE
ncbi:MAG: DUF2088 domain-containing protein [SAR324 cluster bacterium]|nr:DUF2088 domain-containing protein [SAR324 cluster bacterium]